jgi:hypothetical protein
VIIRSGMIAFANIDRFANRIVPASSLIQPVATKNRYRLPLAMRGS